jgi:hypothetical protein
MVETCQHSLNSDCIGIGKYCFFRREENWKTQRKTLKVRERTNNKLNSHKVGCIVYKKWLCDANMPTTIR